MHVRYIIFFFLCLLYRPFRSWSVLRGRLKLKDRRKLCFRLLYAGLFMIVGRSVRLLRNYLIFFTLGNDFPSTLAVGFSAYYHENYSILIYCRMIFCASYMSLSESFIILLINSPRTPILSVYQSILYIIPMKPPPFTHIFVIVEIFFN